MEIDRLLFDKEGNPITMQEFAELKYGNQDYARIAETTIGQYWISTDWIGYNLRFSDGPPVIFETMVFDDSGQNRELNHYQERYCTEEAALRGHEEIVSMVRAAEEIKK